MISKGARDYRPTDFALSLRKQVAPCSRRLGNMEPDTEFD